MPTTKTMQISTYLYLYDLYNSRQNGNDIPIAFGPYAVLQFGILTKTHTHKTISWPLYRSVGTHFNKWEDF